MSYDAEGYLVSKSRKRADDARWFAQSRGGDPRDYEEAIQEHEKDRGKYFSDEYLTSSGFIQKAIYRYTAPDGQLLFDSVKYVHPATGSKKFLLRRWNPHSGGLPAIEFLRGLGGLPSVLYAWPQLNERIAAALAAGLTPEVFLTEGEKDADRLIEQGLIATTVPGGNWGALNAEPLAGCDLFILEDNDSAGRSVAARAADAVKPYARTLRIVRLPGLGYKQDVSDWLDGGETVERLLQISRAAKRHDFNAESFNLGTAPPAKRNWIYGFHYIGGFIGATVSPGGLGKSSLALAEAVAMTTGRNLLGPRVDKPYRVLYWNGEDPIDEIKRRLIAICQRNFITQDAIADRLFIVSGRDAKLSLAEDAEDGRGFIVNYATIAELKAYIREHGIDVMIVDPFVRSHGVNENDNRKINAVAEAFAEIADDTGVAIELIHHVRKSSGADEYTVEDGRGASALHAATRSMRVLNGMTKDEAVKAQVRGSDRRSYFRVDNGKSNMRPAADAYWFKVESVTIPNGPDGAPGDAVGVVLPFVWPKPTEITPDLAQRIQDAIHRGPNSRKDAQAKEWAGIAVANILNLDINSHDKDVKKINRSRASEVLASFVAREWLSIGERTNKDHKKVPHYRVAKWAAKEAEGDDEPL